MFASLAEARAVIERWRCDYNQVRPHSAHRGLSPAAVPIRSARPAAQPPASSAGGPVPSRRRSRYEQPGLHIAAAGPRGSRSVEQREEMPTMAMGRQESRQGEMLVTWDELPSRQDTHSMIVCRQC